MLLGILLKALLIYGMLSWSARRQEPDRADKAQRKSNALELAFVSTLACGILVFVLTAAVGSLGYPLAYLGGAGFTLWAFRALAGLAFKRALVYVLVLCALDFIFFFLMVAAPLKAR